MDFLALYNTDDDYEDMLTAYSDRVPSSNRRRSTVVHLANLYLKSMEYGLADLIANMRRKLKEDEHDPTYTKTNPMAYVSVLKHCKESLEILAIVASTTHRNSTESLLCLRPQNAVKEEPSTLRRNRSSVNTLKYNFDRFFVEQLVAVAIKDLMENRGVENFRALLDKNYSDTENKANVFKTNKILNRKLNYLSRNVDSKRAAMRKKLKDKMDELAAIKDLYEDTLYDEGIKLRYVDDWEEARKYQNTMSSNFKQTNLNKSLNGSLHQAELENFIHDQVTVFTDAKLADYFKEISYWSNKYDNDIADVDFRYTKLTADLQRLQETKERVTASYAVKQKEIDEFLEIRDEERKAEEHERMLNEAATKIQAWWRGVMVRRHLGPYGKKKKGKGKNKGKPNSPKTKTKKPPKKK